MIAKQGHCMCKSDRNVFGGTFVWMCHIGLHVSQNAHDMTIAGIENIE